MGAMLPLPPALNLKGIDATLIVKCASANTVQLLSGGLTILAARLSIRK